MGTSRHAKSLGVWDPTRYHLTPEPLRFDEPVPLEMEEALAREVLRRGASDTEALLLVLRYRVHKQRQQLTSRGSLGPGLGMEPLAAPMAEADVSVHVAPAIRAFRQRIKDEFDTMPDIVKAAFAPSAEQRKKNPDLTAARKYGDLWPVYYNAGYDDPGKTILAEIRKCSFLGKPVDQGVHRIMAERMGLVEQVLKGLMSQQLEDGKRIHGLLGFQPRRIESQGQKKSAGLSNHAWGLAVDIDATLNPQIVGREVITVLNSLVQDLGWDFGRRYLETPKDPTEAVHAVEKTYAVAQHASDRIRDWLRLHLPRYKALVEKENRIKAAVGEKEFARLLSITSTSYAPPSPATQASSIEAELGAIEQQLQADDDLRRLRILDRYYRPRDARLLDRWATHGIQNLPLALVLAFVRNGFRWGQTYDGSKDAMHFELLPGKVLPPDGPARSLDQLDFDAVEAKARNDRRRPGASR